MSEFAGSTSSKMDATESTPDLIARLKTEQAAADELCKHVQAFREQAGVPAINEMRYAGYHVTLALPDVSGEFDRSHLLKAISHAQRAVYEAAEAGILTCLDQISLFKSDYRLVPVSGVVSDWLDILAAATEAQERLKVPRQTGDTRTVDREAHRALFDKLVAARRRLDEARDELNKTMEAKRTTTKRWLITTAIASCAFIVGLISLFVRFDQGPAKTTTQQTPPNGQVRPL